MNTELCCRSGRWLKHYEVIHNWYYRRIFEVRREVIEPYSREGKMKQFLSSCPNEETIGDCLEVSFVIMLSRRQMHKMWNLVEVLRFTADLDARIPEPDKRANAMMLLETARQWRPVTIELPGSPPKADSSKLLNELMSEVPEVSDQATPAAEATEECEPLEGPMVLATNAEAKDPRGGSAAIPPPPSLGGPEPSEVDLTITDLIPRW